MTKFLGVVAVVLAAAGGLGGSVAAVSDSMVAAAAGNPAGPAAAAVGWRPPLPPPLRVVKAFDPPAANWLAGSRGVDLAGRVGERVTAASAGVVSFAGKVGGVGAVSVTSGALRTTYEPLRVSTHRGRTVSAGQLLGRLALAGSQCLPAACLHFGLLRGSTYLDPMALFGLEVIRLLPLGSPP